MQLAEDTFKRLCRRAGVRRKDESRFVPRLHDLRHAFAVHRLTACYREGGPGPDFQAILYSAIQPQASFEVPTNLFVES